MSLQKDLKELVQERIISEEIAQNIADYYASKAQKAPNRLLIIFGVLGAVLVGLGLILIIAHNWDNFERNIKVDFAFAPLVFSQIICGFTLLRKTDSEAWRESSATFCFFAVEACISLISQIYHVEGDVGEFLLAWMLLVLPLIYLMQSTTVSVLYLLGITYYAVISGYSWWQTKTLSHYYWLLLLADIPFYYILYKNKVKQNALIFHNWLIPLSITIALGTFSALREELMYVAYINLYGVFYLIGNFEFLTKYNPRNGYKNIGTSGTVFLLFLLSFDELFTELLIEGFSSKVFYIQPEFLLSVGLIVLATILLALQWNKNLKNKPLAFVYLVFPIIFWIGLSHVQIAVVLINIVIFSIGVLTIIQGAQKNHLGILNYGLLIISVLVICRFFDTDLTFVVRGVLFVLVGLGFFGANYWMLQKRRTHES